MANSNPSSNEQRSWTEYIQNAVKKVKSFKDQAEEHRNNWIAFGIDIDSIVGKLLSSTIISFPEFRQRPLKGEKGHITSTSGVALSDILYKLKNSRSLVERNRFKNIQEYFYELFSLKLDVIDGPEIVFADENNNEVSHQSIGAGIIEVLIMLTHFIATQNHIFIIDEPELHLHSHAKRMMASLLKKSSLKNQILCITHPTHFIFPKEIRNITLVHKIKGESKIFRLTGLPDGTQSEMATNKLSTILPRVIRADQKEFFFARSVLLVEGDTEYGAMPILSSKMRSEFDNYGVSIISMDGNNFAGFVLLLRAFEIPYLVMSDRDTLANIFTSIKVQGQDIRTSALIQQLDILGLISEEDKEAVKENKDQIVREKEGKLAYNEQGVERLNAIVARKKDFVILSSDFEGVFKNAGYSKLFEEAESKYRKSKVLQGLYIAERVNQIPEEIEKIIHYIIERSK